MIKSLYWALFNTGFATIINLVAGIIIARVIDPEEYLRIALALSYVGVLTVMIDAGLSQKLMVKAEIAKRSFTYLQFYINLRALVLLSISLLILISMHQIHFDTTELLLLITIPLIYCYNFRENIVFNRRRLFKEKTILSIISSIIAVSLSLTVTFMGHPGYGMLVLNVSAVFFLAIFMRIKLNEPFTHNWKVRLTFKFDSLLSYAFFAQLTERIDDLFKRSILFNMPSQMGFPELARNETFLNSPLKIVNKAIERVVLSHWGPLKKSQINSNASRNFVITAILTSLVIFVLISFLGSSLVSVVLGDRWKLEEIAYFQIACFIAIRFLGTQFINEVKSRTKHFNLALWSNLVALIIMAGTFLIEINNLSDVMEIFIASATARLFFIMISGRLYENITK